MPKTKAFGDVVKKQTLLQTLLPLAVTEIFAKEVL